MQLDKANKLVLSSFSLLSIGTTITTPVTRSRQRSQYAMAPEAADAVGNEYDHNGKTEKDGDGDIGDSPSLPEWVRAGKTGESSVWGEPLEVLEWQDDGGEYRSKNGWKGRDLVHDTQSPVRVLEYYVKYGPGITRADENENDNDNKNDNTTPDTTKPGIKYKNFGRGGIDTTLTGIVHFTKRAESHQGYCHGGSMCSIMDDVIGWVGFLVTGECHPWSGFTVQVNSKLQRPVHVDSILLVQAKITNIERRKVSIEAVIKDPKGDENDNCIHATASGLVVVNRGILTEE
jgi:acyl-coenzyme A thioesterase PaaI-like protein